LVLTLELVREQVVAERTFATCPDLIPAFLVVVDQDAVEGQSLVHLLVEEKPESHYLVAGVEEGQNPALEQVD